MRGQWTEAQWRVIHQPPGNTAVFATPGSGKTTTLVAHVAHVVQHRFVRSREVSVITFTREAAQDVGTRLRQLDLLQGRDALSLFIGTFHSRIFHLLLQSGRRVQVVLHAREQGLLLRQVLRSFGMPHAQTDIVRWIGWLSRLKSRWPLCTDGLPREVRRVVAAYERSKRRAARWDYDDILMMYCGLLHDRAVGPPPFRYLLVDEFQDTNTVQWQIIQAWHRMYDIPVFVVGDDDQAIYGFRGANPEWLLQFPQTMPCASVHVLDVNFRSGTEIIQCTQRLIRHNRQRIEKRVCAGVGHAGQVHCLRWRDEHAQAAGVVKPLQQSGVLGMTSAGQDILGEKVAVLARTRKQLAALWPWLAGTGVELRTFHDAKGKEWDEVHLIGCAFPNPYLFPAAGERNRRRLSGRLTGCDGLGADRFSDAGEEERRLFYVAMTRAKQRLFLHVPERMAGIPVQPLPYLRESGLWMEPGES
ncbi:hypothetical protein GCM10010885_19480 [Alicyclobacillus cellulosilyticus]|uniref:DNA 3'-5' helicase n=1 Tax=Alicyclobacillus cellulosilyticus TaxID=1003997 RepID=A0A917KGE6_9BACL|nr:UvrD-helicase domain-containing protein [Alicyclobacillus cellulosilyticus]GGJ10353.1 hypothetical protein GCM10010885_19480 [Alicyclobacillus cellulosilyticus]